MMNPDFIHNLTAPYGPTEPLDAIVFRLNRLYHSFEAKNYDQRHPEIHEQLPPLWSEMIEFVCAQSPDRCWNVLDFGCGTGFEAAQALKGLGNSRIKSLTCYDPSPEMLALGRARIGTAFPGARFCSTIPELTDTRHGYDLLITNSLLHHLPSPTPEIRLLEPIIGKNAWWLLGHEPSIRYYSNPKCYGEYLRYHRHVKRQKMIDPKAYWRRLQILLGLKTTPAQATADAAHRAGLFARKPSESVIGRLVDFNVPHSKEEAAAGRGFDFQQLERDFDSLWRLRWVKTYAFMAGFCESQLPSQWRDCCDRLAVEHPLDGANFCSVWMHS